MFFFLDISFIFCCISMQGLDSGNCSIAPRPLSVPDVDKLQLQEPRIDSYRFSMANLEGKLFITVYAKAIRTKL